MYKKIILFHLLLLAPLCVYNLIKWKALQNASKMRATLYHLQQSAENFSKISSLNQKVVSKYQRSDPNYLYHEVECYPLNNKLGKIQLIESPLCENSFYKEKLEALAKPIKVDLNDLRNLLRIIEAPIGSNEARPQLTFSYFSLKKNPKGESLIYDLNFKLIKREYQ